MRWLPARGRAIAAAAAALLIWGAATSDARAASDDYRGWMYACPLTFIGTPVLLVTDTVFAVQGEWLPRGWAEATVGFGICNAFIGTLAAGIPLLVLAGGADVTEPAERALVTGFVAVGGALVLTGAYFLIYGITSRAHLRWGERSPPPPVSIGPAAEGWGLAVAGHF